MDIDYIAIGLRIRNRRKELDICPKTLAEKTGLTIGDILNLEKAAVIPSLQTLINICKTLYFSMDYLLYGSLTHSSPSTLPQEIEEILYSLQPKDQLFFYHILRQFKTRSLNSQCLKK